MRIIDEATLDLFRSKSHCEWCGRWTSRPEPHHWIAKGMGGGRRLDVPWNLIALCGPNPMGVGCHRLAEDGHIPRRALLAVIAKRERQPQEAIEAELWEIIRQPK